MPIYEYRCRDCGGLIELLLGIGRNSDELICKSCGSFRLEPLISASAISVKNPTERLAGASTCCGGTPPEQGCVPGSCCGKS